MKISRRQMLRQGASLAALGAAAPSALAALAARKVPVGLQLYSVRKQCGQDLPGTLAAVAKIGYKGVEFAGYYGRSAADLRKLLDDNGLVCCGTHTGYKTVVGDALKATIEFNKTLGNKFLIIPGGLPGSTFTSLEGCKATAKILNEQSALARAAGMYVGYHAHGGDFKKIGEETVWDLLFSNTDKDVVMQMDVGNCIGGGGDPYATIKKFPGRTKTIHLKEHGGPKGAALGAGTVKWKEVFDLCETVGGTEWYVVEHETGADPIQSVGACYEGLKKFGKV